MGRHRRRRRVAQVFLVLAILTLAITGLAMAMTHANALADFNWSEGLPASTIGLAGPGA
jgi:hypothetical protein